MDCFAALAMTKVYGVPEALEGYNDEINSRFFFYNVVFI